MTSLFSCRTFAMIKDKFQKDSKTFHVADFLLGLSVFFLMVSFDWESYCWSVIYKLLEHMKAYITCIQSMPVGLKLNAELNDVLATFFTYHITLCQLYLSNWKDFSFRYLPYLAPFTGGTVFIGILLDVISIVTIHIRCFDLYSRRISQLSRQWLVATFYAFRGKKWNPLRNRVDFVDLDFRQRLLTTVEFLLIVALLPTTLVYCVGFLLMYSVVTLSSLTLLYICNQFKYLMH